MLTDILPGNIGIGRTTCLALARKHPQHIYLSARNPQKAAATIEEIKAASPDVSISYVECDLASLDSVVRGAKQFTSMSQRLDILICNAGIIAPPGLTADGYELQFGTNHVGHALLIKLLLPTMLKTAQDPNSDVRLLLLTSDGHKRVPTGGIVFKDLHSTQTGISTLARYGQSKLANLLYAKELARRYPAIKSVSVHPGAVTTNLTSAWTENNIMLRVLIKILSAVWMATAEEGAWNTLWAATATRGKVADGAYYTPVGKLTEPSMDGKNEKLAGELWDWTEKELEKYKA